VPRQLAHADTGDLVAAAEVDRGQPRTEPRQLAHAAVGDLVAEA
jgi:hypothetical protein